MGKEGSTSVHLRRPGGMECRAPWSGHRRVCQPRGHSCSGSRAGRLLCVLLINRRRRGLSRLLPSRRELVGPRPWHRVPTLPRRSPYSGSPRYRWPESVSSTPCGQLGGAPVHRPVLPLPRWWRIPVRRGPVSRFSRAAPGAWRGAADPAGAWFSLPPLGGEAASPTGYAMEPSGRWGHQGELVPVAGRRRSPGRARLAFLARPLPLCGVRL